ncbi:GlcG/HbpS family heme-binding protein [Methylobacterium sp. C33D]|uniref:GlcG/HbpS family heme-binding protein n=1 Tax=Methylobacterium mesophilicum TaxID=39956 RepID=UPI002F2E55AB
MCGLETIRGRAVLVAVASMSLARPVAAEEALVTYRSVSPDIALEIAQAAMKRCRDDGLQIAVVVMDRFGAPLVLLRDRFAGLPSAATASSKAYTALSFRSSTAEFARGIENKRLDAGLGRLPNVVAMAGGLPVEAGGSVVGAVGVSGAPGGDRDEACAAAGIEAVRDRLDF